MAEDSKTFQLRYVGSRFEGARLPLDVLSDLPAFRDLLVSYAKSRWRTLNRNRKRIPRGFDKSISFDLVSITEGSAMPKLEWRRQIAQAVLPEFTDKLEDLVDESFRDLVGLVDGAGHSKFPTALSWEHIRALNTLGSGLLEAERIEFPGSRGADGNVVYLDTQRRKALITRVRETYQTRYDGIGTLVAMHLDGHIGVITADHGEVKISVDSARISDEFNGNIGSEVQFALQIELDNNDLFRRVVDVYEFELIDAELSDNIRRCEARLVELGQLNAGWHDGAGNAVDSKAVNSAKSFLAKRPFFADAYRVYPTDNGGVLFEFEIGDWDLSVEFGVDGSVEMYGVQIDGTDEIESQVFESLNDEFIGVFDARAGR